MFKIEKCILNYACFKHPWLVEVMSMLVDINEKIVLSLWSPGRCFLNFRAAIFKNTFFPEHLQWVLSRIAWTLITAEKFNNLFITKMLTPQNCVYVCVCVCMCVCVCGRRRDRGRGLGWCPCSIFFSYSPECTTNGLFKFTSDTLQMD